MQGETIIVGAGIGGLVSAVRLATAGLPVTVVETATGPGGKARNLPLDGHVSIDAGPTVLTMRPVFERIFEEAGSDLDHHVSTLRHERIARHAWSTGARLDLFADRQRSAEAIGDFAGAREARGFLSFAAEAERIHGILDKPFMQDSKTWPPGLMWRIGLTRIGDLIAIRPYESLWKVLGEHFRDPRLIQLFGRYTTYCGSSPFLTPATLMLIAHVEAMGVWAIQGGIAALAKALEGLARAKGARFRYGNGARRIVVQAGRITHVELEDHEMLPAERVVFNGDPAALAAGLLGHQASGATRPMRPASRSQSALVWLAHAQAQGFPLDHHNVFFSDDYAAEFDAVSAGRTPDRPSVYVCALDRTGMERRSPCGRERMQIIVNAPADGDTHHYDQLEKQRCTLTMLTALERCGLSLERPLPHRLLTPGDFSASFPATGGALYGRASHGWAASFLRPGSRTRIPGLYCAGGATHPGAGVPMAALSGRIAAESLMQDLASMRRSHPAATNGGMSTPSAMTGASG